MLQIQPLHPPAVCPVLFRITCATTPAIEALLRNVGSTHALKVDNVPDMFYSIFEALREHGIDPFRQKWRTRRCPFS